MIGRALITGGAGFIGTNMADRLLRQGGSVVVLDDLSRAGVEDNLRWLRERHGRRLVVACGDVRDPELVRGALADVDRVFHLAAQVAVTTSLDDPREDFGVNLAGTLNLLEEVRRRRRPPAVLFTSTNKVYGGLDDVRLAVVDGRYQPEDDDWRTHGVSEARPLAFCSPYGCSKGGADQYVVDYAASYGLGTVVFRMSCIYGPHQQGNEDQGWVAHFFKQALEGRPITIFGDGRQVRDVLFVDDLLDAMLAAIGRVDELGGRVFNVGGGPGSTVSLLELLDVVAAAIGEAPEVVFGPWRVGDQRWFVSDTRSLQAATGWTPRVGVREGMLRLHSWLRTGDRDLSAAEVR